jgi:hypothetical protein
MLYAIWFNYVGVSWKNYRRLIEVKAINDTALDIALGKLEAIRMMAISFVQSDDTLMRLMMGAILEVIDE